MLLKKKFRAIKEMGYVKSIRNGSTGIGATFENLLGKSEESFEIPDFNGIEIKTTRAYSKSDVGLFNAVPTGGCFHETKRIRDLYGCPSEKDENLKCLYGKVNANSLNKIGLFYYFKLRVDRGGKKLLLEVYDYDKKLIDDSVYWDFDILQEKLYRKLQVLAYVQAWTNTKNGVEYFKYYKLDIYILKGFSNFISLLENGIISVLFKIDSYIDEKRYGMVNSHGIGFTIPKSNLKDLFDIYR